ncbi:CDC73-domain-containing protein [Fistulina hepatica ATCC 64428]|nr:CDC73-domain-containing protein [Fistulina hepatica ATCC 64428]
MSEDCLLEIRRAIQSTSPVQYLKDGEPCPSLSAATHISVSPNHTFPKSTPTRWRKDAGFYGLDAIYLAYIHKQAPAGEYMKQARENGLGAGFVSISERKAVVDWLEGTIYDHPSITPLDTQDSTTPRSPGPVPATSPEAAQTPTAPSVSSPNKRRAPTYVPDAADLQVVKKIRQYEVEWYDRTTILRGTKTNNFTSVGNSFAERMKKMRDTAKPGHAPSGASGVTTEAKMQAARKGRNVYPIIMISSAPTSLITMHNVKKFLENSSFEPSQEAKQRSVAEGNSGRPEDVIAIYRKLDDVGGSRSISRKYFVVDSVDALSKFGADAWDRVVCVITTGQLWQLKPYKWKQPTELFRHVKGFHLSWSNDPPKPAIKDWNVTDLKIDPLKRHIDKSVVAHFWKLLDSWMLTNKAWLLKN